MIAATGFGLVVAPLAQIPAAQAATDGSGVVISEVYGAGGNAGAAYNTDFVELYNPTNSAISLSGMSVQYRSATGTANPTGVIALSGSIAAGGHYLVGGATGTNGAAIPTPDASNTGVNLSGTTGTVFLARQTTALTAPPTGSVTGNPAIADLVGFGTSNTFEGSVAPAPSSTSSIARDSRGSDTDVNSADFTAGTGSPENAGPVEPPPPPAPEVKTIEEIQGTGAESTLVGQTVTTRGVVTAAYPTGGFKGFYIQTPGTGGTLDLSTHTASDGLFVYMGTATADKFPAVGDYVEVTGPVSEFGGMTQVSPAADGVKALTDAVAAPKPAQVYYPATDTARETLEGMLVEPQGRYTVADNYSLNQYAEIGLARGGRPLIQPTDVARPGSPEAAEVEAANAARAVKLDDGASINFLSGANRDIPLPYLTRTESVRVGAAVTFTRPVILDYRNTAWKFQPTSQLTADNAATVQPATFEATRTAKPEAVGGDLKIASFNVLNYFTETGAAWESDGGTCSYYTDRAGNKVTVNSCNGDGPRGAADKANLLRQQEKIVSAINSLGADVLSLEEIENSAKYAGAARRDDALATLVDALNADAGQKVWNYVPSPATRPALADEDVIRTAFIYKRAKVETVGTPKILTGAPAFANAREPLAQVFKPRGGTLNQQFLVVVNHFKSKGSGVDDGTGQGNANPDRVAQAKALVTFVDQVREESGTKEVFLTGDFNSYTQEDPMQVLYNAGYTDIGSAKTDESTYLFGGLVGSLDHVLANSAGFKQVTGADVWNINSVEPVAYEYSRHNYNATDFYAPNPYRSSDHDPLLVGIKTPTADDDVMLDFLNINDFHGRIDSNTTKFATTIERLRDYAGDANTLFMSAGDNIGASVFASASDSDNPTIDTLNALGMSASAVGNHEFDQGYGDLTTHVADRAHWTYLGANVYKKGTMEAALPEYKITTIDGVKVGVIGAVTEETPSLVSPGGITDVEFGKMVDSVNRVADQLTDGNPANGEADVLVAEYHEGSGAGTADGANLAQQVAKGGAFADIVEKTSPKVSVIFTGHTHKAYAWDAPVPGAPDRTRPVVQTGQYGENIGQVRMFFDPSTKSVVSYVARNVARAATADLSYPRVQAVKDVVDPALAAAAVKGGVPVGEVTGDITRAFTNGTVVDGKHVNGTTEDRLSESTLGNLVADSLLASLSDPARGGAEIGVANPGGLRDDLKYAGVDPDVNKDGVITYAEANAVLPFMNNLWTATLTGAQFKTVLEQQWQRDGAGNIPTRPFLHLGLSSNVSVTLDPTRAEGDRVTSVRVNGEPLDPAKEYRIGTFSFLAQGGDNFWEFKHATNVKDSGLIDRDAWIDYLSSHSPVSPRFDRREVYAENLPAEVKGGDQVSFTLKRLDLTSNGSPVNTDVTVVLRTPAGDQALGDFPVTDGTATVAFTAPAEIPAGSTVVVTADPSGTVVTIPATVTAPRQPAVSTTTATVEGSPVVVGQTQPTVVAQVTAGGNPVDGGIVEVYDGANRLGSATVANGEARIQLPAFDTVGTKTLDVRYLGDQQTQASSTTVTVEVTKAPATASTTTATVSPKSVVVSRTKATVTATVTVGGQPATGGTVEVFDGFTRIGTAAVAKGAARISLAAFDTTGTRTLVVRYSGTDTVAPSSTTVQVDVVKAGPRITVGGRPTAVHADRTRPRLTVTLTAPGQTVRGTVVVRRWGKVVTRGTLVDGKVTFRLASFPRTGKKLFTVRYLGSSTAEAVTRVVTIRVVR